MLFELRLRAYALVRASRFRLLQVRPTGNGSSRGSAPTSSVAQAPARVLLVGSGVLAGYGVEKHADAVAGPLAQQLAVSLQRSVVVDCRVSPMLPMREAVDFIGVNGSHTYDAVVFAPCFLEGQFAPGPTTERRLSEIVQHLAATGRPRLGLVLLALPRPEASSALDAAIADAARHQAEMMHRLTDGAASMTTTDAPPFTSVADPKPFDAAYYRRTAEILVAALTPLLVLSTQPR